MANNDPKIGVEFVTSADPKGAQQAAEAIKQVGQAAQQTVPAQQQLAKAGEESVKTDAKATAGKKELQDATRALSREIPILSRALDLLKSPFAALGAVVAVVWAQLRDLYAKLDQAEAMAQKLGNLGAEFGKFQVRAVEATLRVREFGKELGELVGKGRDAGTMLGELNELLAEQQRLTNESEEGAKIRQRNDQMKLAEANRLAAQAEAVKVGDARFQLPGAIKATVAAQVEADKADVLAAGTAADFEKRAPELQKRIRDAEQLVVEADRAVDRPPGPRHYGQATPSPEQLQKQAQEARQRLASEQAEYDQLVNQKVQAQVNARVTRERAGEALGFEEGLRGTIRESTARGMEFNERADRIGRGVLRRAEADPRLARSRPPGSAAGAEGLARAGGQMERGASEIETVASSLNRSIDQLMEAIRGLGSGSTISDVNRKLDRLTEEVRMLQSQGRNGRF